MPGSLENIERLAALTANRIKLLQADFADEPDQRLPLLREEVDTAVKQLPEPDRPAFLAQLADHFPAWDINLAAQATQQAGMSAMDEAELNDPGFLVGRLIELLPTMPERHKEAVAHRLAESGLAPQSTETDVFDEASMQRAQSKLGLRPDETLDPSHVLSVLVELSAMAQALDRTVRETWKAIAPNTDILSPVNVNDLIRRYAAGDPEVSRSQLAEAVERTRQLIGGLILAIGQAGPQFGNYWAQKAGPQVIESLAQQEKGLMTNADAVCWRKYKQAVGEIDQHTVELELKRLIAEYGQNLIKGFNR